MIMTDGWFLLPLPLWNILVLISAGSISVFHAIMECTQDTRGNGLRNIRSARFQTVLVGARCNPAVLAPASSGSVGAFL